MHHFLLYLRLTHGHFFSVFTSLTRMYVNARVEIFKFAHW